MKKYIVGLFITLYSLTFSQSLFAQNLTDGDISNDVCISLVTPLLRYRSTDTATNGEVSIVQDFLIEKGLLSGQPVGFYGRLTVAAVKNYQHSLGISPTGNIGALTKSYIQKETCGGVIPISQSLFPIGCTSMSGFSYITGQSCKVPSIPILIACTQEARMCSDGSMMPRDANCTWREDKCPSNFPVKGNPVISSIAYDATVGGEKFIVRGENLLTLDNGYYLAYKHDCASYDTSSCSGSLFKLQVQSQSVAYFLADSHLKNYSGGVSVQVFQKGGTSVGNIFTVKVYNTTQNQSPYISSAKVEIVDAFGDPKPILLRVYGNNLSDTVFVGSSCGEKSFFSQKGSTQEKAFDITVDYWGGYCSLKDKSLSVYMVGANGVKSNVFYTQSPSTSGVSPASAEIIGSQSTYISGQTIKFSVKGIDSTGAVATPAKGLHVQSSMKMKDPVTTYSPVIINGVYQSFNAEYNYTTKMWDVTMTTPSDTSKSYIIEATFYCSSSSLGCVSTSVASGNVNGQITKSFAFTISGVSTSSSVEVMSMSLPTLTLQYDSAGKESMLVGKATVKITAGSNGLSYYLYNGVPSSLLYLRGVSHSSAYTNSTKISGDGLSYGSGIHTLSSGQTATYPITITTPTKELFADTYSLAFRDLTDGNGVISVSSSAFKGSPYSNSLTIVGETSPYITKVVCDSTPNVNCTISGVRFDQAYNTVNIGGTTKQFSSFNGGTSINFTLSDVGITQAGTYIVTVTTGNGASNRVAFIASSPSTVSYPPSAELVNPPTLSLEYDSAGKESMLVGKLEVKIKAGSKPFTVGLRDGSPFLLTLVSVNEKVRANANSLRVYGESDFSGNVIQANSFAVYKIHLRVPTKELFAGTYSLSLNSLYDTSGNPVYDADFIVGDSMERALYNLTKTIIGETSPYLTSVVKDPNSNSYIINGSRFDLNGTTVTIGDVTKILPAFSSAQISFVASDFNLTQAGTYVVQASTGNGASNRLAFTISTPTYIPPSGPSQSSQSNTSVTTNYRQDIENILATANSEILKKVRDVAVAFSGATRASAVSCVDLDKSLHRGKESPTVSKLQTFLVEKGYLKEQPSGFFGDLTISAVKAYQRSIGIRETGMVYDATRQAIKQETCDKVAQ